LNALFTKGAGEIEQPRQEWCHYTAEQCRRAGKISIEKKRKSPPRDDNYKMADGGAPANDHQQMSSEGGKNSIEKKRKSPPRDPDHVIKGTGERAENDLEQRCSEGGSASVASCALARAQHRRNEDD
jgi:hypothetical protein